MVSKRAQEEMVGFVLIIVLVAVIAVIFLTISLRGDGDFGKIESQRIASLLSVMGQITTTCEIPRDSPRNIGQLISKCYQKASCSNGGRSCEVLEDNLKAILEASYLVEEGSFTRYYTLKLTQKSNNETIISEITKGEIGFCPGRILTNSRGFTVAGIGNDQVIMEFEVCLNSEN